MSIGCYETIARMATSTLMLTCPHKKSWFIMQLEKLKDDLKPPQWMRKQPLTDTIPYFVN